MAFIHSPKIVTDGLVLYLDAANTKSYTSGSATWTDLSGNLNSGSLINNPQFSRENNGSIVFNGINQQVIISSSVTLELSSDFTISTWLYRAVAASGLGIITKGPEVSDFDYMVYAGSNGTEIVLFKKDSLGNSQNVAAMPIFTGSWTNFSYTLSNGNSVVGYTNGIRGASGTYTNSGVRTSSSPLRIGRGQSAWMSGSISLVQIYDRALSANEVLQNFNATRGRFGV